MGAYSSYGTDVPKHKLVTIDLEGLENTQFVLDDEFSFDTSSNYGCPIPSGGNDLLTLLSGVNSKIPSGQFTIQSAQIWQSTSPLDIDISVQLFMKNNARTDVVQPISILQQFVVPNKAGENIGMLIPPGPNLSSILNASGKVGKAMTKFFNLGPSKGMTSIHIGKFYFHSVMLKKVNPTYSSVVDESGFPISAKISLQFTTLVVPTKDYVATVYSGSSTSESEQTIATAQKEGNKNLLDNTINDI